MSKIIKNTSLYTIGNIVPKAAGFFLLPLYTRYLEPAEYGIVGSMEALSTILAILFTLAVERSIFRLYWDYKTKRAKEEYLGSIVLVLITISSISLLFLFVLQNFVSLIYTSIPFFPYYAYVIINVYLAVFSRVPMIYLQLNEKAAIFVTLSIAQFLVKTSLILWFVIGLEGGAEGMLKGQMISSALMLPVFLVMTFKIIKFSFKFQVIRETLSFSLPMLPTLLSAWILNLSDRVFIEKYFSLTDVGIYSLGYRISGLVVIVSSAFRMAYSPAFYRLANSDDQTLAKKQLFLYNNTFVWVVLLICVFLSLFSKEAIVILLDARYSRAYKIVPILALGYFVSQAGGLMNLSIYQEKKTASLMFIMFSGALLNIGLNFLLVPIFGAYGAAYATVISFIGMFSIEYWYAKKCYFIGYDWKTIIVGLLLAIPLVSIFYFIDVSIYISLFVKLVVSTSAMLFLYVRFGNRLRSVLGVK